MRSYFMNGLDIAYLYPLETHKQMCVCDIPR